LADPRTDGGRALLDGLLTPVRSGVILLRADLARGAAESGLGLRAGERRYALEAMFSQDAGAVLQWLSGEAHRQAARHSGLGDLVGAPVARFWRERASGTGHALEELAMGAREVTWSAP